MSEPKGLEEDKWNECYRDGVGLMLGGVFLGSCASILTMTPFPFLVLSGIGLYSAVENCDNIFKGPKTQVNNTKGGSKPQQ